MCRRVEGCERPTREGTLRGFCAECFMERWWNADDQLAGLDMPAVNIKDDRTTNWTLTMVAAVDNPNFISDSARYTLSKVTRNALRRLPRLADYVGAPGAAPGNFGHSYLILQGGGHRVSFGYVPGGVKSPDTHDHGRGTDQQLGIDYSISCEEKNAVCRTIEEWMTEDSYELMSSNCTRFVKECGDAAGIYYVGNRIPAYRSSGLNFAYTPNNLFSSLSYSSYSYDPRRTRSPGAAPNGALAASWHWLSSYPKSGLQSALDAVLPDFSDLGDIQF